MTTDQLKQKKRLEFKSSVPEGNFLDQIAKEFMDKICRKDPSKSQDPNFRNFPIWFYLPRFSFFKKIYNFEGFEYM